MLNDQFVFGLAIGEGNARAQQRNAREWRENAEEWREHAEKLKQDLITTGINNMANYADANALVDVLASLDPSTKAKVKDALKAHYQTAYVKHMLSGDSLKEIRTPEYAQQRAARAFATNLKQLG